MDSEASRLQGAIERGNLPLRQAVESLREEVKELRSIMSRTGGGSTPVVVSTPAWTEEECDFECELTGTRLPKAHVDRCGVFGKIWLVHPGVTRFVRDSLQPNEPGEPVWEKLTLGELEVPPEYLETPTREKIIVKQLPLLGPWEVSDLPKMNRRMLYRAARSAYLKTACRERGIDYRHEDNDWIVKALMWCREGGDFPAPSSTSNRASYRRSDSPPPKAKDDAGPTNRLPPDSVALKYPNDKRGVLGSDGEPTTPPPAPPKAKLPSKKLPPKKVPPGKKKAAKKVVKKAPPPKKKAAKKVGKKRR